jgi:hypothetical protein
VAQGKRSRSGGMPTLRTTVGLWKQSATATRPGQVNVRRQTCGGLGPEASPNKPPRRGNTRSGRLRCGAGTACKVRADQRSVGKLAAMRHSTGEAERQMPVIGERECGELPPPLYPSFAAGRTAGGGSQDRLKHAAVKPGGNPLRAAEDPRRPGCGSPTGPGDVPLGTPRGEETRRRASHHATAGTAFFSKEVIQ